MLKSSDSPRSIRKQKIYIYIYDLDVLLLLLHKEIRVNIYNVIKHVEINVTIFENL